MPHPRSLSPRPMTFYRGSMPSMSCWGRPLSVADNISRPTTYREYLKHQENRLGAHLEAEIQRYTKAIDDAEQTATLGRTQLELCRSQLARLAKWPEKRPLTRRKAEQ